MSHLSPPGPFRTVGTSSGWVMNFVCSVMFTESSHFLKLGSGMSYPSQTYRLRDPPTGGIDVGAALAGEEFELLDSPQAARRPASAAPPPSGRERVLPWTY